MEHQSDIHYRTFIWEERTAENGLLLIGGICDEILWPAVERKRGQLQPVSFAGIRDAYDVDAHLSCYLEELWTDIAVLGASDPVSSVPGSSVPGASVLSASVLGASVFVPGTFSRSGGIIGSPGQSPASASAAAELEELPNGFFLWTQPGGPGVAFRADRAVAGQVLEIIKENLNESIYQQAETIRTVLDDHHISPYLIVCDGSGPGGCCRMVASDTTDQASQETEKGQKPS